MKQREQFEMINGRLHVCLGDNEEAYSLGEYLVQVNAGTTIERNGNVYYYNGACDRDGYKALIAESA